MRTPLIVGNWKMYKTRDEARALVDGIRRGTTEIRDVETVVCPPAQLLFPVAEALRGSHIKVGAQNAYYEKQGAYTGEISVPMLKDAGCTHVIIGHSERRYIFGEAGPLLAKKVRAVVGCGLTVIYCVGETLDERESGRTASVVERQVAEGIDSAVPPDLLVVAYEPVWAIGTGRTATPDQAQEVHAFIRLKLATVFGRGIAETIRILYGGSVKPGNAAGLLDKLDIDGSLVGGACLAADDFVAIIKAAQDRLSSVNR